MPPGFDTLSSCALLETDESELVAEVRVSVLELGADAQKRLIESEAGLHADGEEIESIRQGEADALATLADEARDIEVGSVEGEDRTDDEPEDDVLVNEQTDENRGDCRKQKPYRVEDLY